MSFYSTTRAFSVVRMVGQGRGL